jgi:nitroimidazol reductase NimA-like FMN-containing flavoprotein (pyridoxamine 5'-phosphate oxidase superfamily)
MLKEVNQGVQVCVTVTLLDGLVLARSIFNHSMNYRSVVILGQARVIDGPAEKLEALRRLSEHIIPGRWKDSRFPNERELKATTILRLPIAEFSAKVRQGPVIDDVEDMSYPTWAGVLPLPVIPGKPIPDQNLAAGIDPPDYVGNYRRDT